MASSREKELTSPEARQSETPSRVPGFEAPPRGADSPPRAPLPRPRAPRASPRCVPGRWPPWRAAHRAGGLRGAPGPRRGRAGCGTRSPGRLRLNGSNMATSWKLPLAAAAGEAAERAPPPPAGPASLPGSAPSQHAPRGWDRPGVSAAWREVLAAGAAGTCSPRGGGPGLPRLGDPGRSPRPAACPWEARSVHSTEGCCVRPGAPPPS